MFDKQDVDEYRKLTAPSSLKARVMTAATVKRPTVIRLAPAMSAIAACLALLVIATSLWMKTPAADVVISTDGMLITSDTQVMTVNASPRLPSTYSAVITLKADGNFTIQTSDVFYIAKENGEFILLSSPYHADGELTVYWSVTEPNAQLTVNGTPYTLYADIAAETVSIHQNNT